MTGRPDMGLCMCLLQQLHAMRRPASLGQVPVLSGPSQTQRAPSSLLWHPVGVGRTVQSRPRWPSYTWGASGAHWRVAAGLPLRQTQPDGICRHLSGASSSACSRWLRPSVPSRRVLWLWPREPGRMPVSIWYPPCPRGTPVPSSMQAD